MNIAPTTWSEALADRRFRVGALVTLVVLAGGVFWFGQFVGWVETREGVAFVDPLLRLFDPVEISLLTFSFIYLAIVVALVLLARRPRDLVITLQSYVLLAFFRMIAMYLLPLDPPATMLPLVDPIVGSFSASDALTRDLFFSGHTSTTFLLALTARGRVSRRIFGGATLVVAACVLLQHVHYTVDVFVAPFVAFCAWRLVTWSHERR